MVHQTINRHNQSVMILMNISVRHEDAGDAVPNAEKLTIIRAKIFKIWAKYTATFTCNEVVSIFQTEAKQ